MAEHSWYDLLRDFQPAIAALIAFVAVVGAYITTQIQKNTALSTAQLQKSTALTVASDQISEQRRKEVDELLRLRLAATIQMLFVAGGVNKDLQNRKIALSALVKRRKKNQTENLNKKDQTENRSNAFFTFIKGREKNQTENRNKIAIIDLEREADEMLIRIAGNNDDFWAQITKGPIRDSYPIFNTGISIVSHASIACQEAFYSVLRCVTWYDETYRTMLSFAANNGGVLIAHADTQMDCLDSCIAQTGRDIERFDRELNELTAAQVKAESALRQ